MAVSAGKAVFCEKPLALSSAETRQCLAAAEKNKVPIYCGFQRRWDPNFLRLKTALEGTLFYSLLPIFLLNSYSLSRCRKQSGGRPYHEQRWSDSQ